jgi:TolB protein
MRLLLLVLLAASASAAQVSEPKRLTNVIDSYPALSPDGTLLVFQSNRTGTFQIYTIKLGGTDLKQLTKGNFFSGTPSWSPDGKQIVYGTEPQGKPEVWIMNADGSSQHPVATGDDDEHPHWNANGRIVFNSARTTPDPNADWSKQWHEVFSMKPDGSDVRQHSHCKTVCTFPSMSPDGTKLAYRKVIDSPSYQWDLTASQRNSEVFVANADGSCEINVSKNAAFDGWPMWAPDSKRIAFASNRMGPASVGQIFVVNADGTGLRQITTGPHGYAQPSWSPDGKKIYAYQNVESADYEYGGIVVIDVPDK